MKLTPDLVEGALQYIHPATRDREVDLRGYKISVIENLGATLDQFDSIDFSDNEIRRLEGFPVLIRIKKLLLSNNKITRIEDDIGECLPNLEWLILTNNNIEEVGDIDCLAKCHKLECLCLLNNPVSLKEHYRLYVIHKIPQVRILDFRKVKVREREEAAKMFKGKKGRKLEEEMGQKTREFVPGEGPTPAKVSRSGPTATKGSRSGRTAEEIESIKEAIARASTLQEVERLNQLLKSGFVPGQHHFGATGDSSNGNGTSGDGTSGDGGGQIEEETEA